MRSIIPNATLSVTGSRSLGITGEIHETKMKRGDPRWLDAPNIWNFALRSINTAAVPYADRSIPLAASFYRCSISSRSENARFR